MDAVSEETIIKGLLVVRVGISTVSSSLTTMYAVSIYLFATALLLFAAVILFILHWRHQIVKSRKQLMRDNLDSPETPLTNLYQNCQLKYYETLQEKVPSVDSVDSFTRYSQYDNYMANDYEKNYEMQFSRKAELI